MGRRFPLTIARRRHLAALLTLVFLSAFIGGVWIRVNAPKVSIAEFPLTLDECWVFTHLNKAGGSTVKDMLRPWIAEYNVRLGLYDSTRWEYGPESTRSFIRQNYTITWGGYTEALRPYGAQECKWFTMFRHPTERLVSAYFYCKKKPEDRLCGSEILSADEVDLVTFAKHWGNFGLRQFLFSRVSLTDVVASEASDPEANESYPPWWRVKRYFENHAVNNSAVAAAAAKSPEVIISIEYILLKNFLAPVKELLSDRYSAVGILEDWPTTLRLFNSVLKMPSFNWEHVQHQRSNVNHQFLEEVENALRLAREDPDINELIRLDLLLYEHARQVHAKQVAEYHVGGL